LLRHLFLFKGISTEARKASSWQRTLEIFKNSKEIWLTMGEFPLSKRMVIDKLSPFAIHPTKKFWLALWIYGHV
jgi:hypothetical protein